MEYFEHWHIWLIAAFIVLIIELMTGTYFLLAVAGGAGLASIITAWFTPSLSLQMISFAIASVVTYIVLLSFRKPKDKENTDGTAHMIGKQAEVIDEIAPQGRVRYKGVLWQAISDESIAIGKQVEIVAVNGSTLTVKNI